MSLMVCRNPPNESVDRRHDEVPPEIFYTIFDILEAECTTEELRACYQKIALIWKRWLPFARSRIFHKVDIGYPRPSWPILKQERSTLSLPIGPLNPVDFPRFDERRIGLAKFVTNNPSLASSIHHLSYSTAQNTVDYAIGRRTDPCVPAVLLNLPQILSLSIRSHYIPSAVNTWSFQGADPLTFGFRRVMDRYLSTGTLTTLSLSNVRPIPIMTILESRALRSLSINCCEFVGWTEPAPKNNGATPYFKLRNLSVHNMRSENEFCVILPYLSELRQLHCDFPGTWHSSGIPPITTTPLPPFQKLQVLRYEIPDHLTQALTYFTNIAGQYNAVLFPSLKSLTLTGITMVATMRDRLPWDGIKAFMEHCPALEAFTFKVIIEYPSRPPREMRMIDDLQLHKYLQKCRTITISLIRCKNPFTSEIHQVCNILRRLQGKSRLQDLKLVFQLDEAGSYLTLPSASPCAPWSDFDEILAGNTRDFPFLRSVSVDFEVQRARPPCDWEPYDESSKTITAVEVNLFVEWLEKAFYGLSNSRRIRVSYHVSFIECRSG